MNAAESEAADEVTRALVRDVGRQSVAQLGEGITRMIGETSALSRWLLTMLVALNGAGLVYCITRAAPLPAGPLGAPLPLFFGGVMVALFAAIVGLLVALPAIAAMRSALALWSEVASSGDLSDEAMAAARSVKRMGSVWMVAVALCAMAALGLFLAGVATVSDRLAASPAPAHVEAPIPAPPQNAAEPAANGAGATTMLNEAAIVPAVAAPAAAAAVRRAHSRRRVRHARRRAQ